LKISINQLRINDNWVIRKIKIKIEKLLGYVLFAIAFQIRALFELMCILI